MSHRWHITWELRAGQMIGLDVPPATLRGWEREAKKAGMPLAVWIRWQCMYATALPNPGDTERRLERK